MAFCRRNFTIYCTSNNLYCGSSPTKFLYCSLKKTREREREREIDMHTHTQRLNDMLKQEKQHMVHNDYGKKQTKKTWYVNTTYV